MRLFESDREARGLDNWKIRRILEHIDANLETRIEVAEIASLVGLSSSHFSRMFRKTLGVPPSQYIAMRRIDRVKLAMTFSTESLAEIAVSHGFADQAHMSKSFRRRVGVSPGVWRRVHALPTRVEIPVQARARIKRQSKDQRSKGEHVPRWHATS